MKNQQTTKWVMGNLAIKQTLLLFGTQILLVFIGLGIKYIQTHALGENSYGIYAFFGTITSFSVLFFRFGFISSLQVLLADMNKGLAAQKLMATGFLVTLALGILYSFFLFAFSFFVDDWFSTQIGYYLFWLTPLCFIFPFRNYLQACATGSNKFAPFAAYDIIAKTLFLVILWAFWHTNTLNLWWAMLFNVLTLLIAFVLVFPAYEAKFKDLKSNFELLVQKNKTYGIHFYFGTLSNLSTYKLDEFLIVYFLASTSELGFYTLAAVICSPMVMLSQALSNVLFKSFAQSNRLPPQIIAYNLAWLLACMIGIFLLGNTLVDLLFGETFAKVKTYLLPLSVAYFFQGMYQPYNFLTAKSEGKAIRNVAFAETIVNIIGNFALIPIYGVMGAIMASIAAKCLHWLGKIYYYQLFLKQQTPENA